METTGMIGMRKGVYWGTSIIGYMGGCQNFGYSKYRAPYYNRDPKMDHNFDNHPNTNSMPITHNIVVSI